MGVGSGDGWSAGGEAPGSSVVADAGVGVGIGSSCPSEAVDTPVTSAVGVGEALGVGDCWLVASGDAVDGSAVGDGGSSTVGTLDGVAVAVASPGVEGASVAVGEGVKPFPGGPTIGARGVAVGVGTGGSIGVARPSPFGHWNLPLKM